jgi:hypothetical protein
MGKSKGNKGKAKSKPKPKPKSKPKVLLEMDDGQKVDLSKLEIRNLMPGILVVLTCHLRGGRYTRREDIKNPQRRGQRVTQKWTTVKVVEDEEQVKEADKIRAWIRRAVAAVCMDTAVGSICPVSRSDELAKVLGNCHSKAGTFNGKYKEEQAVEVLFRFALYNVEGANKGALAAVSEQLADILKRADEATLLDDAAILEQAPQKILGQGITVKKVMTMKPEERRAIVARVRAEITRKAISEAKGFESLLPEEAGLAVSKLVADIRKNATAWVKASKEGEEEYEAALADFNHEGVSAMQATLVQTARQADEDAADQVETALAVATSKGLTMDDGGEEEAM